VTGLLGGAFDPPHNGHLVLARGALESLGLERLVVVVTGTPPHKQVGTDAETRFRLAEAAFADMPRVVLSRHELERPGPSYTVETVRWAAETFGDVVFVVGADEFADFLSWHDPEGVLRAAPLAVATRPGFARQQLDAVLERLSQPERVELFEIDALPVSSTEIRERVARGEPIDDLVPPGVAELVAELGLYREGADAGP
jgi:nicotinate-nucleotide adenylyltransferase